MSARIYDRPDLDQRSRLLPLLVVGDLPKALPSAAYEGRLQIYNAVGGCTVRQIDGDRLPPGHQLYVDQATKQVVLTWPAYQAGAAPIANPGFESGATGWDTGAGWVIATENPPTGSWAAGYNNQQGESVISNTARYECYSGQRTTAKCKVRQGASAEGNAGASVLLEYRDQDGQVVGRVEGNRVMSASKNRVYDSNVVGIAPAGAATINIAGNGIRYRENKILFVDDFEWDHTVAAVGLDHQEEFRLTLQVSDSAGRSAIWKGVIGDRPIYFTSKPYPLVAVDDFLARGDAVAGTIRTAPDFSQPAEIVLVAGALVGGDLRMPFVPLDQGFEPLRVNGQLVAGDLRAPLKETNVREDVLVTGSLQSGDLKQLLIQTTSLPENLRVTGALIQGTLV